MIPGFAMGQTPVQVGQSDVYSLRWALPADPGKDELSRDERSQPVLSPDAQFIFRAYSNGRVEKRLTSNGEVQWVRDLGIEVRGALAYIASFEGQIASPSSTPWGRFMFSRARRHNREYHRDWESIRLCSPVDIFWTALCYWGRPFGDDASGFGFDGANGQPSGSRLEA